MTAVSIAFVCDQEEINEEAEHDTAISMIRCSYCDKFAIGGFICTCGHSDVDAPDQLWGHQDGACLAAEVAAGPSKEEQ